jgi:DNA (cytosine-5)-methyltransferase 1
VERVAAKVPDRRHRLACLGNAVVPAQAYPILRAIAEIERGPIR